MKKMIEWLKNNLLVICITLILGMTINTMAETIVPSVGVSYSNSKTAETTVNGALNELFEAVDINERLGNTNLSNVEDGTVTGILSTLYNNRSHIGMVIQSTTLDTMAKVIEIYGGTKWVKIEGRFLLGASSSYAVNSTGGATSVLYTPSGKIGDTALTVAQLPSHTHTFTGTAVNTGTQSANHTHTIPKLTGSTTTTGTHYHSQSVGLSQAGWDAWVYTHDGSGLENTFTNGAHNHDIKTNESTTGENSANHTHSVTAKGSNSKTGDGSTHTHTFTGTTQSVSTMSPYKVVYIWERTE